MMDREQYAHLVQFIAIAEACHRKVEPSYSWHILDWMSYKGRCRWPLVRHCDRLITDVVPF